MTLAALLTLTVGLTLVLGPEARTADRGKAEKEDDTPTCTKATLKGRYLFGGIATLLPPAVEQQSLLAVAGYHIFNGDGTGTDTVTAMIDGVSVEKNAGKDPDRSEYDITYTVNEDCSGTYTVPAAGASFGLYVAPNGEELMVIGTIPGFVLVQGPSRRVSRK
jgi:hypothetical protein